jgi:hypothetical protein
MSSMKLVERMTWKMRDIGTQPEVTILVKRSNEPKCFQDHLVGRPRDVLEL